MQNGRAETRYGKKFSFPGACRCGGGYLEGSQSVYISRILLKIQNLLLYGKHQRNSFRFRKNKIWSSLKDYKIDKGEVFSQAYVARDLVYSELSKCMEN
jgi:hypothetical protein